MHIKRSITVIALAMIMLIGISASTRAGSYLITTYGIELYGHTSLGIDNQDGYQEYATAYNDSSHTMDTMFFDLNGWNNDMYWHITGNADYACNNCTETLSVSSNTFCEGYSTGCVGAYATTKHGHWKPATFGGWVYMYSSDDGAHSSYNCFTYGGC